MYRWITFFFIFLLLIPPVSAQTTKAKRVKIAGARSFGLNVTKKTITLQKLTASTETVPREIMNSAGILVANTFVGEYRSICSDESFPDDFGPVSNDVTVTFTPSSQTTGEWSSTGRNLFSPGNACADPSTEIFSGTYVIGDFVMILGRSIEDGGGQRAVPVTARNGALELTRGSNFFALRKP